MTSVERDADLQLALESCKESAAKGYKLAQANLRETRKAVQQASGDIQAAMELLERKKVHSPEAMTTIRNQLAEVMTDLEALQREAEHDLAARKAELDNFNVSLFGRTMAGKSTIMEILIEGDGRSIGKGEQRTTRDVRDYVWRGLKVTDVPGVAAFEGKEDEDLAFAAASKADLVLFLITDDAPQAAEAECLAKVRQLGKPVLGVCNVKQTLKNPKNLDRFIAKPEKYFDMARLGTLKQQFFDLADQYLPGARIPFVYMHANARFLADHPEMRERRSELLKASRFYHFEKELVRRVNENGRFFRLKTFVDATVGPMLQLSDQLLAFREANSMSGRILIGKLEQMKAWQIEFAEGGRAKIDQFVGSVVSRLEAEIPAFAEDHYADKGAEKAWSRLVEGYQLEREAERLLRRLMDECQKRVSEFLREINAELQIIGNIKAGDIHIGDITDTKSRGRWAIAAVTGALGLVGLFVSGPVGWAIAGAGVVVGLLGWLWDRKAKSREAKVTEARRKLENHLNKHVQKMKTHLHSELTGWFERELLSQHVSFLISDIRAVVTALFKLADTQRGLADILMQRQQKLNMKLMQEAMQFKGYGEWQREVKQVARIPGFAVAILIKPDVRFPESFRRDIEQLTGERLIFVIANSNPKSVFTQLLKRKFEERPRVRIDEKLRVAHLPLDEFDQEAVWLARLGQQLTGLHVMV